MLFTNNYLYKKKLVFFNYTNTIINVIIFFIIICIIFVCYINFIIFIIKLICNAVISDIYLINVKFKQITILLLKKINFYCICLEDIRLYLKFFYYFRYGVPIGNECCL